MANEPALNQEGFNIPTLKQYQDLMRQQAIASVGPNAPGYSKLMQSSVFDLMRSTGHLSPNEKLVGQANTIQQQANDEVAQSGETDPAKMRLMALTSMVRRFNAMGMSDLSAKAMPELTALQQRAEEMQKLKTGNVIDASKARVALATEGADIQAPVLKNEETEAQTDLAIANKDEVPSKILKNKADASNTNSEAMARNNEGIFYYKLGDDGQVQSQTSVRQSNTAAREALRAAGWIEAKQPGLTPATTGGLGLPKAEQADLLKQMFQADTKLDQYRTLAGEYKPEYLTMGGKIQNFATSLMDKAGMKLDPDQKAAYDGFTRFRAGSISALNQYIHDITGAQMSVPEADRIRQGIPDVERDGPAQYLSKMRAVGRQLVQARERARDYLKAGGDAGMAPQGDQWDNINKPEVTDAQVDQFLNRYFGIPTRKSEAPSVAPGTAPSAAGTKAPSDTEVLNKWKTK